MISVLHFLLALVLIGRWRWLCIDGSRSWLPVLILTVRVAAGWWCTGYYLQHYGGGDMHVFFKDSLLLSDLFFKSPSDYISVLLGCSSASGHADETLRGMQLWYDQGVNLHYNDARTVIRFHALVGLFSGGQIIVHLLWSNVVALAGSLALLRFFFTPDDRGKPLPLYSLLILFLPASLIWSSMLLKEPLLLFALGVTLRYFQLWMGSGSCRDLLILLIGLTFFLFIKSFWLLVFLPGMMGWMAFRRSTHPFRVVLLSYVLAGVFLALSGAVYPRFDIPALLFGQQLEGWRYSVFLGSGSLFHPLSFAPDWFSLIKHGPEALHSAVGRPWPDEFIRISNLPFIIENFLVLSVGLAALWQVSKGKTKPGYGHWLALIAAVIILAICGYISSNSGSLVRYRLPGLLLLAGALWSMAMRGAPPKPGDSPH